MFNPLKSKLDNLKIILATSSKQRHEIVQKTGIQFQVIVSDFEEDIDRNKYTFSEYVQETAYQKLLKVEEKLKDSPDSTDADVIIAMDTMVCCDGQMMGKPKDKEDAAKMLKKLTNCGFPHLVYTGVAIKCKNIYDKHVEVTTVYMNKLTDEEIQGYIDTGEPMGKAGAYAIQGIGASFVRRIDGDFNNVVGLPLCSISKMLKKILLP